VRTIGMTVRTIRTTVDTIRTTVRTSGTTVRTIRTTVRTSGTTRERAVAVGRGESAPLGRAGVVARGIPGEVGVLPGLEARGRLGRRTVPGIGRTGGTEGIGVRCDTVPGSGGGSLPVARSAEARLVGGLLAERRVVAESGRVVFVGRAGIGAGDLP